MHPSPEDSAALDDPCPSGFFVRPLDPAAAPAPTPRALVVADDEHLAVLRAAAEVLAPEVAHFRFTADWDEARRAVVERATDLCVAGHTAPCPRLGELLSAAAASPRPCPVVVLARADDPAAERAAFSHGAADWHVHPKLTAGELGRAVRQALARHQHHESLRDRARLAVSDRLASLTTLAAGLTHELNNPLQVLVESLGALRRDPAAPALGDDPHAASLAAVERLRRVARDLAAFTRTEGDDASLVDLSGPLEAAIRLTAHALEHRARVSRALAPAPRVRGNVARLTQLFVNLLLNAARAIPAGDAARHEVRIALAPLGHGRVQVTVADTGEGMTPEVLGRAFDPFFTTRPVGEGAGLGLSVCHGIARAMGGAVTAESEPGRGSVFRVVLPAAAEPAPASTMPPTVQPACGGRRRVAVIDDDPMVCRSLTRLLQGQHEVVPFTEPAAALDALCGGAPPFDAILCDVMMPEMSGIELYQRLVARDPALAARLVFVTGGAFAPEARSFLAACAHRVVQKPATQATLLRAIATVTDAVALSG